MIKRSRFDDLSSATLYDILRLRTDIFVVEQECVYLDADGLDLDPATEHLWVEDDDGAVIAYARVLRHDDRTVIGRVVTRIDQREHGLGRRVMRAAVEVAREQPGPIEIKAQSRLAAWYGSLGFVACGPEFEDVGIMHTPMRLAIG